MQNKQITFVPGSTVNLTLTNGCADGFEVMSADAQNVELKAPQGYAVKLGWSPVVEQWILTSPPPTDRRTAPARVLSVYVHHELELECQCGTPGIVQCDMHGPVE
jgi:hypothetical protein